MKIKYIINSLALFLYAFMFIACSSNGGTGNYGFLIMLMSEFAVTESSEKAITSFVFTSPATVSIINQSSHTIEVTVPYGTDISLLTPVISYIGESINPETGVTQNFSSEVIYTVTAEDTSTQDYTVTVIVSAAPKAITSFNFTSPVVTCVIYETMHSISLQVPCGTDVTALVPTIAHTGASVNPASGVPQDFTNEVVYTVTGEDGLTQEYTVVRTEPTCATVTTTSIAFHTTYTLYITGTTARGGGNVTNDGNSTVSQRGLCWNTTGNPTLADSAASDMSYGLGNFSVNMDTLIPNTVYHVRAYAKNHEGTAYGNEITFNSGWILDGTEHFGGYIFYNDGNGGGLVCAPSSTEWTNKPWGIYGTTIYGTSTYAGYGDSNTSIIDTWLNNNGYTGRAAQLCSDLSYGGFDDWFLPSKDELNLIYSRLKLGGYDDFLFFYWSSSEYDRYSTWMQRFSDGTQDNFEKDQQLVVRAVRAFTL